jgi:hypothetical protein
MLNSNSDDETLYSDSVFSMYLYTGNGSTQTITNGIDLAGKGGLVWQKRRNNVGDHTLSDTARGINRAILTDYNGGEFTGSQYVNSFNNNGFTFGNDQGINKLNDTYASWTFRKAPKFFDIVTYTGDGTTIRAIPHSLGIGYGLVLIKRTDSTSDWGVYARDSSGSFWRLVFNTTAAYTQLYGEFQSSTVFYPSDFGSAVYNVSGATYVTYLFAHDTSSTGIIQCGSYTGNGSATGPIVSLGWEPQWLMIKNATGTGSWQIIDNMRGMSVGGADATLQANASTAENSVDYVSPTATGFQVTSTSAEVNTSSSTYIYMAIRRPNKPPTSGTQVYNAIARTGTRALATVSGVGFAPDFVNVMGRSAISGNGIFDKMRGPNLVLVCSNTGGDYNDATNVTSFDMDGVTIGTNDLVQITNVSGRTYINHFFKRAPGFMDIICYTGNGAAQNINHNLLAVPSLIITKLRNFTGGDWFVFSDFTNTTHNNGYLNQVNAFGFGNTYDVSMYFSSRPSSSVIPLTNYAGHNSASRTYIMYLFATLDGISKVGSYTGNGSSQTIACGFAAGARFIMIKCISGIGDWYVWDSVRGIVAANDPHLSLNTTAAEVTTDDSIDPDNSGFIVNQNSTTSINITSATYIFLAIA